MPNIKEEEFCCPHVSALQKEMPDDDLCFDIADFYKIFSDSSRLKILFTMLEKEICVHDISLLVNMSQSSVSHQLKFLRQSKVVKARRQGRLCYYSLDDDHIHDVLLLAKEHLNHKQQK
ncbi:MAG: metalloregulator ArsR/SmtB family transcription factor [Clostridia bacterium]